jgi:anti-sigma B factor antagonist
MTSEVLGVRDGGSGAAIIDIKGEVTARSEDALMGAFSEANEGRPHSILLNFTDLEYMNSSGIGLLVTLLVRTKRQRQQLFAFGLTDHYRQIFELTRLDEAVGIHDTEGDALAAAGAT